MLRGCNRNEMGRERAMKLVLILEVWRMVSRAVRLMIFGMEGLKITVRERELSPGCTVTAVFCSGER